MKRVWLVGPISWDTVIEIDSFPTNGAFAQGKNRKERAGGSASNTAIALASTGVETHLISCVGDDLIGEKLVDNLKNAPALKSHITTLAGPSLHAVITIDKSGERTVFALEENRLTQIDFNFKFDSNDILCFPVWRDFYLPWLLQGRSDGAFTIIGLTRTMSDEVEADLAVASAQDIENLSIDTKKILKTIITKGADGSTFIEGDSQVSIPAIPTVVKDATGAGDSYLAGVLYALARGESLAEAMQVGTKWATVTVEIESSIPPNWSEVCRRFGI
jgi:sugar/nucleoside kinase (ribokinase family)